LLNKVALGLQQLLGLLVAVIHQFLDFEVDFRCRLLAVGLLELVFALVADETQSIVHTVHRDESVRYLCDFLDVVRGTRGHCVEEKLLCDAAAECHLDHVDQRFLVVE